MSKEKEIKARLKQFAEEMRPLPGEFADILHDNLWDLYLKSKNNENLRPIPDYLDEHDIVTLHEWDDMVKFDVFIPDDGDADYGTATHVSDISAFRQDPPAWATHVILFGK